tara:strand:- start:33 stop:395 length:363 start_codon:yes stop_codon:yes gene_type:complete
MSNCKGLDRETCIENYRCQYVDKHCMERSMYSSFIYGGMGYGSLCLPAVFTDILLIVFYPPLFVFFHQKNKNFENVLQIVTNFILTCFFYFPGLLHALHIKFGKNKSGFGSCGSMFQKKK